MRRLIRRCMILVTIMNLFLFTGYTQSNPDIDSEQIFEIEDSTKFDMSEDVQNPGKPANWSPSVRNVDGEAKWTAESTYNSPRSLKITASGDDVPSTASVQWVSNWVAAPPAGTVLQVSAMAKGQNIVRGLLDWHQLRIVMYFQDDQGNTFKHRDIASVNGTFDWHQFKSLVVVGPNVAKIRISFILTACTGTAWLDEMSIKVLQDGITEPPEVECDQITEGPVIFPQPWKVINEGQKLSLGVLSVDTDLKETRVYDYLEEMLSGIKVSSEKQTKIYLSNDISQIQERNLQNVFPTISFSDLGQQGYFLSVKKGDVEDTISIFGKTEEALFYGVQTLSQIIDKSAAIANIQEIFVVDKPSVNKRGIAMGYHWFKEKALAIKRMAELKLNYIFIGGNFAEASFDENWRLPLTVSQKASLGDFRQLAYNQYIDITLSIRPVLGEPHIRYSSQEDLNIIIEKLSEAYQIGFRKFTVNFDDLNNWGQDILEHPEDIDIFHNSIAEAHYYFVNALYMELKNRFQDIELMLIPLISYNRAGSLVGEQKQYLEIISRLPKEIIILSVPESDYDLIAASSLTGRKPFLWYNYYAFFESAYNPSKCPDYVAPFEFPSATANNDSTILGHIFLPVIPGKEDEANISWLTSADYLWNPKRYDSKKSFDLAVCTNEIDLPLASKEPNLGNNEIKVWPNPVDNKLYLKLPEFIFEGTIEISDIKGNLIDSISFKNKKSFELHLDNYPSGFYVLYINTPMQQFQKKIIKK